MTFTQGRTVLFSAFISHLDDFKLEMFMKVQVSSIWKKKKIYVKSGRIWTHDLENLAYHANH